MATAGATVAVIAAQHTSSYRVKFKRKEFLELVEIAKPKMIYHQKIKRFKPLINFVGHLSTLNKYRTKRFNKLFFRPAGQ